MTITSFTHTCWIQFIFPGWVLFRKWIIILWTYKVPPIILQSYYILLPRPCRAKSTGVRIRQALQNQNYSISDYQHNPGLNRQNQFGINLRFPRMVKDTHTKLQDQQMKRNSWSIKLRFKVEWKRQNLSKCYDYYIYQGDQNQINQQICIKLGLTIKPFKIIPIMASSSIKDTRPHLLKILL